MDPILILLAPQNSQRNTKKKEATDPGLNDNSIANQSQFYYEKSLAIIENEINIINSRSSFLAQIEGLLFAGYGVCLGLYAERETTAAFFLIILIPIVGAAIAVMTLFLVKDAEKVICSVENEWESYKKDNEQNPHFKALSFPPLSILQSVFDKKKGQNKCTLVLTTSFFILLMWICVELFCLWVYKNHLIATVSLYFPFYNEEQYNTMYWRTKNDLSSFSELKITKIEDNSFSGCSTLSSIIIPPTVTTIGNHAFSGCVDLNSLVIPDSVDEIGKHAFSGCTGITSIVIPSSVKKIDDYTFSGCTGLSAVLTSDEIQEIGNHAFSGCTGLTSIAIPPKTTTIGKYAFANCKGLSSILIPEGVEDIRDHAFSGCTGLTSIVIPPSVKTIGPHALSFPSFLFPSMLHTASHADATGLYSVPTLR